MLKGERGFLVFIVICLVAGAIAWAAMRPAYPNLPTNEYKKAEETEYSPGSANCYPSRLKSLSDGESLDERYRCETQAEQHRLQGDDLVQQTRAADASVKAVDIAFRQSLIDLAGAIFGMLTLLAAAYAAWYARKAAESGGRANEIALKTSRGYLAAVLEPDWTGFDGKYPTMSAINIGKSDCLLISFTWIWCDEMPSKEDDLVLTGPPRSQAIPAGKTCEIGFVMGKRAAAITEYLVGVIRYRTMLNSDHRTYFVYRVDAETAIDAKPDDWFEDT